MISTHMTTGSPRWIVRPVAAFSIAIIAALVLSLLPGAIANAVAQRADIDPNAKTELIITKFQQPDESGPEANGLPADHDVIGEMTAIAGVTFQATLIPGVDLKTTSGWQAAVDMTASEAKKLTAGTPAADSGVTGADGVLSLGGKNGKLGVGAYLVEETDAPAGVVVSAPFVVILPMNHPNEDRWLYEVYVYPKNEAVQVDISVNDEDAISHEDEVIWTTRNSIPEDPEITHYLTRNVLAPSTVLDDLATVKVVIESQKAPALTVGADFQVQAPRMRTVNTFDVEFTEVGRAKLAAARDADPNAHVVVVYPTRVLESGSFANEVHLFVNEAKPVVDTTLTKFGPLNVLVYEKNNPSNLIKGATFKLYPNAADAGARRNAIEVDGIDEWTSDEKGRLTIDHLRFSNFSCGLDRAPGDPLYRSYWVAPVSYPAGWSGEWEPLEGVVDTPEQADAQTLEFRVWKSVVPPSLPVPGLPVTGAQLGGIGLLAAVLLLGGATLLVRRKKNSALQGVKPEVASVADGAGRSEPRDDLGEAGKL